MVIIPDNEPPQGQYVSTVQIENYIQRCFIDLLGREALDEEMTFYFNLLKTNELSNESRDAMLLDLQQDTSYRDREILPTGMPTVSGSTLWEKEE